MSETLDLDELTQAVAYLSRAEKLALIAELREAKKELKESRTAFADLSDLLDQTQAKLTEAHLDSERLVHAAISTAVKELRSAASQVNSEPLTMRYTLKGWMLRIAAKLERA